MTSFNLDLSSLIKSFLEKLQTDKIFQEKVARSVMENNKLYQLLAKGDKNG